MSKRLEDNVTVDYTGFYIYRFDSIFIKVQKNGKKGVPYAEIRVGF